MLQPSVCSEGKGMGGMRGPCVFSQTGLSNLEKEIFQSAFSAISLRQGKDACSFLPDAFMKKKLGEIFEFHFKMI